MAALLELLAQFGEVLDDAVVHDGDMPATRCMRMRVGLGRPPVRGPSRVPDAARAREVEMRQRVRKAFHLALAAHDGQRAVLNDRHARRVVPAVLEPRKPRHEHALRRARSGISNDAAHAETPLVFRRTARSRSQMALPRARIRMPLYRRASNGLFPSCVASAAAHPPSWRNRARTKKNSCSVQIICEDTICRKTVRHARHSHRGSHASHRFST